MLSLLVNGRSYSVDAEPDMPLLWVLRDRLRLTGTKYGCGTGQCGACTVHVEGSMAFACVVPLASVRGKAVTTIEGLAEDKEHPIFQAWLMEGVSQCGYCQPAQIMAAAALLAGTDNPSDSEIDEAMAPILCRCGTYQRIRRAIHRAAEILSRTGSRG
jgi:aerobic-type carbon monoxide dehydrogenase small subunit (CoxS/CutS family)